MPKFLLLRAYSNDENYDGGVECAYLELTPELARLMLDRVKILRSIANDPPSEIRWWTGDVLWTGRNLEYCAEAVDVDPAIPDGLVSALKTLHTMCEVPANIVLSDRAYTQTEADEMVVDKHQYTVRYTALLSHCEVRLTSAEIPLDLIEAVAKETP